MSVERREEARSRLLQRGKVVFNGGFTALDCIVTDVSERGARLKVAPTALLPKHFELRLKNRPPRLVEICHRGIDAVGVRFVPAA